MNKWTEQMEKLLSSTTLKMEHDWHHWRLFVLTVCVNIIRLSKPVLASDCNTHWHRVYLPLSLAQILYISATKSLLSAGELCTSLIQHNNAANLSQSTPTNIASTNGRNVAVAPIVQSIFPEPYFLNAVEPKSHTGYQLPLSSSL